MIIRKSTPADLPRLLVITELARQFMAETGNPNQWRSGYPTSELLLRDMAKGNSYVCEEDGLGVVATFYFGIEEEPTYAELSGGQWLNDEPYGVIHRLASSGEVRGVARFVFDWCCNQVENIRVDTHADNRKMQELLTSFGFTRCGVIIASDGYPRFAYQRTAR